MSRRLAQVLRFTVGALVVGALVFDPGASRLSPRVQAFDWWGPAPFCGDRSEARIAFTVDAKWDTYIQGNAEAGKTLGRAVELGRDDWIGHEIMHYGGYVSALTDGGDTFTMRWKPSWYLGGSDVYARTSCSPSTPEIAFNDARFDDFRNGVIRLRGVAAHEWGHAWGIGHSGKHDSHGGGTPTMSTCHGNFTDNAIIAQDDSAAIQHYQNRSGHYGAATANPSFEEGWKWWGFRNSGNGHRWIRYGGQDNTRRYLRFRSANPADRSYIFSTTRMARMTSPTGSMAGSKVKARGNYRKVIRASTGTVLIQARVRAVEYSGGYDAKCQIVTGANDHPLLSGWVTLSTIGYPASRWRYSTTGHYTVPQSIGGVDTKGIDVRVYLHNRMRFGGDYVSVDVDRVRVLVDA